ncbi:MAG: cytochrome c [Gammaproteobacteria bacterium]|jgi:cytochrome c553|nr:cytochrome c [Gammaproteobacteria bacterium]|tara:strand:- start:13524 stop:13832 length:309 start_codon:yes stop_codon:yes gene_type:complete
MKAIILAMAAVVSLSSGLVQAADIDAGKAKAASCAGCHGGAGISPAPMYPNLAGQKEMYLYQQLAAFQSGERNNAMMASMVAGLSDDDMKNIAAYYASLSCQ